MGAECSTLWHKVSPYVYKNVQILIHSCDFHLNLSTAYAWIGMISRSSPSRDGIVIRTQRYPFSHLSNITQISLFCFLGELTTLHMVAVPQTSTINSLSFHLLWISQTHNSHMCSLHVGQPQNQQVDGYLCTYVDVYFMEITTWYSFSSGCYFWLGNN